MTTFLEFLFNKLKNIYENKENFNQKINYKNEYIEFNEAIALSIDDIVLNIITIQKKNILDAIILSFKTINNEYIDLEIDRDGNKTIYSNIEILNEYINKEFI